MHSNNPKAPSRRRFLIQSSTLVASAAGCTRAQDPGQPSPKAAPLAKSELLPWPEDALPTQFPRGISPFGPLPTRCPLVEAMTLGPCTTQPVPERQNISEGWPGLATLLMLRLIRSDRCEPLAGLEVEIWHTNHEGSYSGQTPANDFCVFDQDYAKQNFFRGTQRSDNQGIVRFITRYPGWYPGRAIHIHLRVKNNQAQTRATQLYFPAELNQAVFAHHPLYRQRGQPDTPNAKDDILARATRPQQDALTLKITRDAARRIVAHQTLAVLPPP